MLCERISEIRHEAAGNYVLFGYVGSTQQKRDLVGPAPNISLVYPVSCKPKDTLAAQNYNAIRNWLYPDLLTIK